MYTPDACDGDRRRFGAIAALKRERNAVILAHNYQRPEILEVADFVGDSLELAAKAATRGRRRHRLLRRALHGRDGEDPEPRKHRPAAGPARRLLARRQRRPPTSWERRDELRKVYPDLPVVSYVNTTAAVKACSDVCCTSSNAAHRRTVADRNILFVPDRNLARYVQEQTEKNIIPWDGNCYVHQQITPEQHRDANASLPDVQVLVHPECRADVLALADAVLSTSGMVATRARARRRSS